jgi:proteasome lid subunit RPN8/RPN11/DNA-directed RNA polymerase subunit RPC12/RpoP
MRNVWHTPLFVIECCSTVLDLIRHEVEQSRDSQRGGRETGGVLFGVQEPGLVRILTSRPLPCEHAMGAGFVLSEKDEKRLAQLISSPAMDPELNGLEALGWYHSHIRSRIFLSERDQQIHSRYFAAPYQIALVIHTESNGSARAGFFFHEHSGDMRADASYEEFTIETARPAAPEVYQPVVSKRAQSHWRKSSPKSHEQPHHAICPRCGSKHFKRSHRTRSLEQLCGLFGFYPYRCHECLSRSFLKTRGLWDSTRPTARKRPEEVKRARLRKRREILLWGGGILGFLAILHYLVKEPAPKSDQP